MRRLDAHFSTYMEVFDNAQAIVDPYLATDSMYTSPYQIFLDDLEEINMEKSKK